MSSVGASIVLAARRIVTTRPADLCSDQPRCGYRWVDRREEHFLDGAGLTQRIRLKLAQFLAFTDCERHRD